MDLEVPVRRIVTNVYSRREGRGQRQRDGGTTKATSAEATSSSSGDAGEGARREEGVVRRCPPAESLPTTPPRKRASLGRMSSTSQSSSPSPSKISLDQDIKRMYSPKGSIFRSKQSRKCGSGDESGEDLYSGPYSCQSSPRPPKYSFADRMLPRKQRENSAVLSRNESSTSGKVRSTLEEKCDIDVVTSDVGNSETRNTSILTTEPIFQFLTPQKRTYGRSAPSQVKKATLLVDKNANKNFSETQPHIQELKKRWDELDDFDETDDEEGEDISRWTAIRNNTRLRLSGRKQRFKNTYQYHVLDLNSSLGIEARKEASVALAEIALLNSEDDAEEESDDGLQYNGDGGHQDSPKAKRSPTLNSFLKEVKAADLIGQLWKQLRRIGAGSGEEKVIDTVLALVCVRIFQCDAEMSLVLVKQEDFHRCMTMMMSPYPPSLTQSKSEMARSKALSDIAKSTAMIPSGQEPELFSIVLNIISKLADVVDQPQSQVDYDLNHLEQGFSMSSTMWKRITAEAALASLSLAARSLSTEDEIVPLPNGYVTSLIAQTFANCASQASESFQYSSASEVITLLRFFAQRLTSKNYFRGEHDLSHVEPLGSLLRMTIAMMAAPGSEKWTAEFLKVDDSVTFVGQLTCRLATALIATTSAEAERACALELCSLCLALLIDSLVKGSSEVRRILLSTTASARAIQESGDMPNIDMVGTLGHLLRELKEKEEVEADVNYLIGSSAVVLALLIIKGEDDVEMEKGEIQDKLHRLCNGMRIRSVESCLDFVIASLNEFAALMQLVSSNCYTLRGLSRKGDEAKEDEVFFRLLSSHLGNVRRLQSSSHVISPPISSSML
ncbi:hypothetical protein CBS101457_002229 [Exobasidium rhododendri]|nr:hypothetical protein CBS101457_002229 [Exobasidium rhododendri]